MRGNSETMLATPAQLASLLARVLDVPKSSVITLDRNLAKAGLRTVGGRGTGAAKMSARDATNLILAAAGTSTIKNGLIPVERHGRMMAAQGQWRLRFLPIPEVTDLGPDHTLADALEAFIGAAASGTLSRAAGYPEGADLDLADDERAPVQIEVCLLEPTTWAEIVVSACRFDEEGELEIEDQEFRTYSRPRPTGRGALSFDPPLDLEVHGDLLHRHIFTHRTIAAVGKLLRG
jgi:hypothetical protein